MSTDRIPLGVSSCLLGNPVRYDGRHKRNPVVTDILAERFELRPFCPEVGIGLGVPRPPIRLVAAKGEVRVVGARNPRLDVTDALGAYGLAQAKEVARLSGFIFKSASPSCGRANVPVFDASGTVRASGSGLFSAAVMKAFPAMPVMDELELADPAARDAFFVQVELYHQWRTHVAGTSDVALLARFHSVVEARLAQRHAEMVSRLVGLVENVSRQEETARWANDYIAVLMTSLRATRL